MAANTTSLERRKLWRRSLSCQRLSAAGSCRKGSAALLGSGPAAVGALTVTLSHADEKVREAAVMALGLIGRAAAEAVPALIAALADPDQDEVPHRAARRGIGDEAP